MPLLLIFLVFAGILFVQSLLVSKFGLRGFSYRRGFVKSDAVCGETVEFQEVIANKGPLLLPWVRLESRIPLAFQFAQNEEIDVRGNNYHKSVFTLMPYSRVTRRHQVRLTHRGHYKLDKLALTMGDLAGTQTVMMDISAPAELYVYPAPLAQDMGALPSSSAQGDLPVPRWVLPDPFLINGIRTYRMGDPERDIHWAATARTGELQVKTHDFTAEHRLFVIINGQKREDQWGDLMEYEQEIVEKSISLAAHLTLEALERGTDAGFAANMPLDDGKDCAYFAPGRGVERRDELLRAFACLQVRLVRSFPTFLDMLGAMQGMDIVLISGYDSEAIRARMTALQRMGNSVKLYVMEGGEDA